MGKVRARSEVSNEFVDNIWGSGEARAAWYPSFMTPFRFNLLLNINRAASARAWTRYLYYSPFLSLLLNILLAHRPHGLPPPLLEYHGHPLQRCCNIFLQLRNITWRPEGYPAGNSGNVIFICYWTKQGEAPAIRNRSRLMASWPLSSTSSETRPTEPSAVDPRCFIDKETLWAIAGRRLER